MLPRSKAGPHCSGVPSHLAELARNANRKGHQVVVGKLDPDDTAVGYVACVSCAAWSTVRACGLSHKCPGVAKNTTYMNRLCLSLHP